MISILEHAPVQVGHVPYFPRPRVCAFSAISCNFNVSDPTCTMFSPPCTLLAWTNAPYIVCCLCIWVPMTHVPHGWTDARTHGVLAQGEYGQFCYFGTCGPKLGEHYAMAYGDLWEPSMCAPPLNSYSCSQTPVLSPKPNAESHLQATMEIYPWGHFHF